MKGKKGIMLIIANLFASFPAIYIITWFIINTILLTYSFTNTQVAPYVLAFACLSLIPILFWRLIK